MREPTCLHVVSRISMLERVGLGPEGIIPPCREPSSTAAADSLALCPAASASESLSESFPRPPRPASFSESPRPALTPPQPRRCMPVRPTVDIVGPDLNRRPRPRQVQALCLGGPGRLSIHGAGIRQVQALCLGGPDRLSIHGAGIRQVQARPTAPALATVRLCPTTPDSDGHRLG